VCTLVVLEAPSLPAARDTQPQGVAVQSFKAKKARLR
jgi:hypothetical protein